MRVFLTSATGYIGSAIIPELISAGHQVVGLARPDAAAAALAAAGADVHHGAFDDLDSLRCGASASDGVIHTAYNHDFSQYENAGRADQRAVKTLSAALESSGRPLVITSGTTVLAPGVRADRARPAGSQFARGTPNCRLCQHGPCAIDVGGGHRECRTRLRGPPQARQCRR